MNHFDASHFEQIPLKVEFVIGNSKKTMGDVLGFRKGNIVILEKSKPNLIEMRIHGKKIAYGKAVRKKGEWYLQLTELLLGKGGE